MFAWIEPWTWYHWYFADECMEFQEFHSKPRLLNYWVTYGKNVSKIESIQRNCIYLSLIIAYTRPPNDFNVEQKSRNLFIRKMRFLEIWKFANHKIHYCFNWGFTWEAFWAWSKFLRRLEFLTLTISHVYSKNQRSVNFLWNSSRNMLIFDLSKGE